MIRKRGPIDISSNHFLAGLRKGPRLSFTVKRGRGNLRRRKQIHRESSRKKESREKDGRCLLNIGCRAAIRVNLPRIPSATCRPNHVVFRQRNHICVKERPENRKKEKRNTKKKGKERKGREGKKTHSLVRAPLRRLVPVSPRVHKKLLPLAHQPRRLVRPLQALDAPRHRVPLEHKLSVLILLGREPRPQLPGDGRLGGLLDVHVQFAFRLDLYL